MISFIKSRALAFRHAFAGWWYVLRTQRNAWIHACFTLAVVLVCLWLRLPAHAWAAIIIVMGMVWTAEFINTAMEVIVDLASPQQHPLARVGKDVGAAAVLVSVISAVLIGLLIIGPPLWEKIRGVFAH